MKHIIFSAFEHSKIKDILFMKQKKKKLLFTRGKKNIPLWG